MHTCMHAEPGFSASAWDYFNHHAFRYGLHAAALDALYGNGLSGQTGGLRHVLATSSVILQAAACC